MLGGPDVIKELLSQGRPEKELARVSVWGEGLGDGLGVADVWSCTCQCGWVMCSVFLCTVEELAGHELIILGVWVHGMESWLRSLKPLCLSSHRGRGSEHCPRGLLPSVYIPKMYSSKREENMHICMPNSCVRTMNGPNSKAITINTFKPVFLCFISEIRMAV